MLFDFLVESKCFRNDDMVNKYSAEEMGEIAFAMLLIIELLRKTSLAKEIDNYARDSVKYPMLDRIYLSTTDLGNALSALNNSQQLLNDRAVDVPVFEIKRYLRCITEQSTSPSFKRALFYKLYTRFRIRSGTLTSLRRSIVDTDFLPNSQIKMLADQLYQLLRKYQYKADILVLLQKYLDSDGAL